MEREGENGRQRGFFVAFGYTRDAEQECAVFHKRTGGTDQRSMAGRAGDHFANHRDRRARTVHCSVWLAGRSAAARAAV